MPPSGTSQLYIPGELTNTGTIEADSGTLDLEANSFAQIASSRLSGGTWKAMNGANVTFPSGTSITANGANITLDGSGAAMPALALASNSGTLALTNGAGLSTPGDFSNSGTLTLDGTLTVGGNFTQTSAGAINEQIAGTPSSGQFGQLVATGTVTLAGDFNLALVNGFTPAAGQSFPVLKYGSATGSFATITGLPSGMTAHQIPTELDLTMPGPQADLSLTSVTAPTAAAAGQSIIVDWQVTDLGTVNADGSWVDSVYISTTQTITASSILLGSITHSGGLTATSSYNASLTTAVPALAPGKYYVLVEADSHFQVADPDRNNNVLAATGGLMVSVPSLTLGTTTNGTFSDSYRDQYYQVTVPAGGSLVVTLTSGADSGATALYVSNGSEPTPYSYQFAATAYQSNQKLAVPNASGGTYYVLVHNVSSPLVDYTLTVSETNAVTVSNILPTFGALGRKVTIEIDGVNFTPTSTAHLAFGEWVVPADSIDFVDSSLIFATFNLAYGVLGRYTLTVDQGAASSTALSMFQTTEDEALPQFHFQLLLPAAVRAGRTAPLEVSYVNDSNYDITVRDLKISSPGNNASFSLTGAPGTFTSSLPFTAGPESGPPGILRPGETGKFALYALPGDYSGDIGVDVIDEEDDEEEDDNTDDQQSHDPNAMVGPAGYGTQEFVKPQGPLPYTVDFENDGSVAAQDVTVTQQLDPNLDWSTLQLGSFGFGPINVTVPAGLTQYQTTVSYHNVDGSALNVDVALNFNVQTGLLTATLASLDPATGLPPTGVTDGFLPPDNSSGIGEGYVQYTVQSKSGLTTGTTVNAAASVVFDTNPALSTKTFSNTIDAGAPTSSVNALPAKETSTSFTVAWSGSDDNGGSGIASYSVFVSDNGGPFTAFQTNTTATSATFTGVNGHTYAFYSVATDNVGNVQPAPSSAQAITQVATDPNERYVAAVYHDVLDRLPDPSGLQYWTQLLDKGTAVSAVAQAIAHSDEYYANFVIGPDYLKLLGRAADQSGVTYWTGQMHNGLTDQQLEAGFI
ncbi:MAG TPA: DUF4214 domain-containing protein, partial [Pirellulales bacterium]|nr:DUF4214 domain-containing protein [Pirellulales bacterium]